MALAVFISQKQSAPQIVSRHNVFAHLLDKQKIVMRKKKGSNSDPLITHSQETYKIMWSIMFTMTYFFVMLMAQGKLKQGPSKGDCSIWRFVNLPAHHGWRHGFERERLLVLLPCGSELLAPVPVEWDAHAPSHARAHVPERAPARQVWEVKAGRR